MSTQGILEVAPPTEDELRAQRDILSQWIRAEWAQPPMPFRLPDDAVEAQDGTLVWWGGVNWYSCETQRTHCVTHWRPRTAD